MPCSNFYDTGFLETVQTVFKPIRYNLRYRIQYFEKQLQTAVLGYNYTCCHVLFLRIGISVVFWS